MWNRLWLPLRILTTVLAITFTEKTTFGGQPRVKVFELQKPRLDVLLLMRSSNSSLNIMSCEHFVKRNDRDSFSYR